MFAETRKLSVSLPELDPQARLPNQSIHAKKRQQNSRRDSLLPSAPAGNKDDSELWVKLFTQLDPQTQFLRQRSQVTHPRHRDSLVRVHGGPSLFVNAILESQLPACVEQRAGNRSYSRRSTKQSTLSRETSCPSFDSLNTMSEEIHHFNHYAQHKFCQ